MADSPAYQQHCDYVIGRTPDVAHQLVAQTLEALRASSADIAMANDRKLLFQVSEAIQNHRQKLEAGLDTQIRAAIAAAMPSQSPARASTELNLDELTLVDEAQAEAEIEISRTVQLIDLTAEWELRELQSFTAMLHGDTQRRHHSNPFKPATYAKALSAATKELDVVPGVRNMLLRVAGRELATLLRGVYRQACERLRQQGLSPLPYRAVSTPERPRHGGVDVTEPGALQSLLHRMPPGDSGPGPQEPATTGAAASPTWHSAQTWHSVPSAQTHADAEAGAPLTLAFKPLDFNPPAAPVHANQASDQQVLGLLSRLFAQMVQDDELQPVVKRMIDVLKPSVQRVALRDPQLLRTDQHPTWRLINQVAAYANGYAEPDHAELMAFVRFLKPHFEALSNAPAPDARHFAHTLTEVEHFIAQQGEQQMQPPQAVVDKLEQADKRQALHPMLRQQVEQQMAASVINGDIQDSIKAFLLGPWVDVLSQAMSAGDPEDARSQAMLATVDDLILSLQRPRSSAERNALRQSLPGLIQRLQEGMALIDLPQAQRNALLDDLMGQHTRLLMGQPRSAQAKSASSTQATPAMDERAQPAPAPTAANNQADEAADLVRQMREEMQAEERTARHADTDPARAEHSRPRSSHPEVVDTNVGTLPTVPMLYEGETDSSFDEPPQPDWVESLQKGSWCKLFLQGQWTTARLLWISANRRFYMFTSNKAGGMHSLTQRALERLRAEGLATSLVERSLMQRAVDSMLQDLDD
jgi:hypothetical protein